MFLRAERQGLLSKVKQLGAFFPLVVKSARAPWEGLCLYRYRAQGLTFNDDGSGVLEMGFLGKSFLRSDIAVVTSLIR